MIKVPEIPDAITVLYEEILLHKSKSVCFTSSTVKEGTTTIASITAFVAAFQQKVLYCDFTNYETSLSQQFNITFQEIKGSPTEQMINNIYKMDEFKFDLMPLPTPLISSVMEEGFLKDLFEKLNKQYDLIIVDTNGFHRYRGTSLPTGVVCRAVDTTVLVVLAGGISEGEVQQTVTSITEEGGGKLMGIIMNDVNYPTLLEELCRVTHYLDKFKPTWTEKARNWLKTLAILNTDY